MKRSPLVIAGTVAGLAGVLTFHSKPASLSLSGLSLPTSTTGGAGSSGTTKPTGSGAPPTTTPATSPSTTAPSTTAPSHTASTTPTTVAHPAPTTTQPRATTTTTPRPTTTTTIAPTTTTAPSGNRTVDGGLTNYGYGQLSVSVTIAGGKISNVGIAQINDGGLGRSVYIDQQAIPILEQEAMQAQSANIQGVSGATYTSEGFITSLQNALSQAGLG